MNPVKHEVRQIKPTELRIATNDKGQRVLTGYAAVFNSPSVDMGGWFEIVSPSAFTRTLTENPDVLCLYSHDTSLVLGRTVSGTLSLNTDNNGLAFSVILPDTTTAADLIVLIERGDISGCSFGFICQNDTWGEDASGDAVRTLLDVDLFEITVTCLPAYPDTSLSLRNAPIEIRTKLAKRDAGDEQCSCPDQPDTRSADPTTDDDEREANLNLDLRIRLALATLANK
jgi:hypothetical protein